MVNFGLHCNYFPNGKEPGSGVTTGPAAVQCRACHDHVSKSFHSFLPAAASQSNIWHHFPPASLCSFLSMQVHVSLCLENVLTWTSSSSGELSSSTLSSHPEAHSGAGFFLPPSLQSRLSREYLLLLKKY